MNQAHNHIVSLRSRIGLSIILTFNFELKVLAREFIELFLLIACLIVNNILHKHFILNFTQEYNNIYIYI
jgi:hypothetical protein